MMVHVKKTQEPPPPPPQLVWLRGLRTSVLNVLSGVPANQGVASQRTCLDYGPDPHLGACESTSQCFSPSFFPLPSSLSLKIIKYFFKKT